ncbi:MAG TPA: zf-TFIIB domain-containing protein [Pyrinomonadaceae bacterium]|nr:zf-TFIIB domain-containing protein [Pyrinomonadaceae bacterium]
MEAETLNCPMCGAATSSAAAKCPYCEARLATVACPKCFGLMFLGSKHCQRCGAAAARQDEVTAVGRKCPRCKQELQVVSIGETKVQECGNCFGLWLTSETFEKICADREQQAAVLGAATITASATTVESKVSYIPCPECHQLMNRANFARCSGVIIDLCKRHGVWFDQDELSRIIEFIQAGGLDAARAKEKVQLEEERRRLEQATAHADSLGFNDGESSQITGIASAGSLLKLLLG